MGAKAGQSDPSGPARAAELTAKVQTLEEFQCVLEPGTGNGNSNCLWAAAHPGLTLLEEHLCRDKVLQEGIVLLAFGHIRSSKAHHWKCKAEVGGAQAPSAASCVYVLRP